MKSTAKWLTGINIGVPAMYINKQGHASEEPEAISISFSKYPVKVISTIMNI